VTNESNERVLLSTLMIIESIFEKKYKMLIMRLFSTGLMDIMNNFSKKPFADTDVNEITTKIFNLMQDYNIEYNSVDRWKFEIDTGYLRSSHIHEKRFLSEQAKHIEQHEKE